MSPISSRHQQWRASLPACSQATTDSTALLSLLKRLDECIAYVTANPQYADAVSYGAKFRQLQSRALGMVRNRAQHVLRAAAAQVQAGAAEASGAVGGVTAAVGSGGSSRGLGRQGSSGGAGGGQVLPEGAEVAVLYVRFRAAAESSLKGGWQRHSSSILETTTSLREPRRGHLVYLYITHEQLHNRA